MNENIFHPEAADEFRDAFRWYASQSSQAVRLFAEASALTLEHIASRPRTFGSIGFGLRSALVRRFPYHVIFRIETDHCFIFAFAHTSRRPGYWVDRL